LRLQKPPLPYWLTAVGYKAGGVNETAIRILAPLALQRQAEIWLITERVPSMAGTTAETVAESGELKLCKLQLKP
jgi:hypothetical protein